MFSNVAAFILIAIGHLFYWNNLLVELLDIKNSTLIPEALFARFCSCCLQ